VAADLTRRLPRATTVRSIENGIDVERVLTAASQGTDESAFAAGLGRPIVIAAGRLVPEKGFDDLLDAVALVSESRPREAMSLVILGDGPLHDSLREKARQLGIADAVHFLGFVINPWAVFAQADVFVLSSRYEGLGLVVAEAVACGLPVVSTDCESGPADVLEGNPCSRLVPVGDASAMAKAIDETLRAAGGPPVELAHKFTLDGMTDRYRRLLHDIVTER
jgi:glycosyltransferase involved in cell wall biosynthesis